MIPQHIYDAIIESPVGKLINRLIVEEHARTGGDTRTPWRARFHHRPTL